MLKKEVGLDTTADKNGSNILCRTSLGQLDDIVFFIRILYRRAAITNGGIRIQEDIGQTQCLIFYTVM